MYKIQNIEFETYQFGLVINSVTNTYTDERLSRMPALVLNELIKSPNEHIFKDDLCRKIWGASDIYIKRLLNNHLSAIRKLLKLTDHHVNTYHNHVGVFKNE